MNTNVNYTGVEIFCQILYPMYEQELCTAFKENFQALETALLILLLNTSQMFIKIVLLVDSKAAITSNHMPKAQQCQTFFKNAGKARGRKWEGRYTGKVEHGSKLGTMTPVHENTENKNVMQSKNLER